MTMRVIAEIGPADGDIDLALRMAVAARDAGAWAVKGQMYTREHLVHRTQAKTYGNNLGEPELQWDNFNEQLDLWEWETVGRVCDALGVEFFLSVFDSQSAFWARELGCDYVKIASADITHRPLIEDCSRLFPRMIMSTGGATEQEVWDAITWVDESCELTLLACTLAYPTALIDANLNRIETLRVLTGLEVGYSDHTPGTSAMIRGAYAHKLELVEKHFTTTPGVGGDHDFAITGTDLKYGLEQVDYPETGEQFGHLDGDGQLGVMPAEQAAVQQARRSLVASEDIHAGETIDLSNTTFLRPGTGLPPTVAYERRVATRLILKGDIIFNADTL